MFGLTRYQWTVLLAAWLGWGFDVFDAFLFNYVAPNCVPTLLGLGPWPDVFTDDAPNEANIQWKVGQMVRELTHFSRGGI